MGRIGALGFPKVFVHYPYVLGVKITKFALNLLLILVFTEVCFSLGIENLNIQLMSKDEILGQSKGYQNTIRDLLKLQSELDQINQDHGTQQNAVTLINQRINECSDHQRDFIEKFLPQTLRLTPKTAPEVLLDKDNVYSLASFKALEDFIGDHILELRDRLGSLYLEFQNSDDQLLQLRADYRGKVIAFKGQYNQSRVGSSQSCDFVEMFDLKNRNGNVFKTIFQIGHEHNNETKLDLNDFSRVASIWFKNFGEHSSRLTTWDTLMYREKSIDIYLKAFGLNPEEVTGSWFDFGDWIDWLKSSPPEKIKERQLGKLLKPHLEEFNNLVLSCERDKAQLETESIKTRIEQLKDDWYNLDTYESPKIEGDKKSIRQLMDKLAEVFFEKIPTIREEISQCVDNLPTLQGEINQIEAEANQIAQRGLYLSNRIANLNIQKSKMESIAERIVQLKRLFLNQTVVDPVKSSLELLNLTHSLEFALTEVEGERKLDKVFEGFSGGLFDLKPFYEGRNSVKNWSGKVSDYQAYSANVFDPLYNNLLNCYSGSLLFTNAYLSSYTPQENETPVMIFTSGHVLPGVVIGKGEDSILYGIETTALGPAQIEYGKTSDVAGDVRVVTLNDFLLVEAFKFEIKNLNMVLNQTLDNLTALNFKTENLFPYEKTNFRPSKFEPLNATPFGFGESQVSDEVFTRPYFEFEKQDPNFSRHWDPEPFYGYLVRQGVGQNNFINLWNLWNTPYWSFIKTIFSKTNETETIRLAMNPLRYCHIKEQTRHFQIRDQLDKNLSFSTASEYNLVCDVNKIYYLMKILNGEFYFFNDDGKTYYDVGEGMEPVSLDPFTYPMLDEKDDGDICLNEKTVELIEKQWLQFQKSFEERLFPDQVIKIIKSIKLETRCSKLELEPIKS